MPRSLPTWVSFAVLMLVVPACGLVPYTANLTNRSIRPPSLMVARPSDRTLFLVIRPGRVADEFPIRNTPHSVTGFSSFLGRALRGTLDPYFRSIVVVERVPSSAAGQPHAVADVRLDSVESRPLTVGSYTYHALRMQWAFALRPGEADEYLFTFGGIANSEHQYRTLDEGCEQMMLDAMAGLMQGWTQENVFQRLMRAAPPPGPALGDVVPPGG